MAGRLPQVDLRWKGNKPPWRWGRWSRWYLDERLMELRSIHTPHKRIEQLAVWFALVAGQVEVRGVEEGSK